MDQDNFKEYSQSELPQTTTYNEINNSSRQGYAPIDGLLLKKI
ncbi:hypothetical protein ALNOE001_10750 [Candidatus Methanobinarius endosymbioticus]|uniref:Uncharacterized protein n=1 Tax=Candidatus Methanobinarius endosymbioticus TaxID=2006182 RepID=A0A366MB72_9EURY|nr:hypothetical protein ALNOE001_10750 [Candidatus Methanobinarius endosymbioticus]